MYDRFGRNITNMRISITQRCNLDCSYCHREGEVFKTADTEMTPAEIEKIVQIGASLGIKRLKLTGGEPLIREDLPEIIKRVAKQVQEVSLTTNGLLLKQYAVILKKAGLNRINISLDTLNREKYAKLTGVDALNKVISGIHASYDAGLSPIKLNMVLMNGMNETEIDDMLKFAFETHTILQIIELEASKENIDREFYKKYHFELDALEKQLSAKALLVKTRELHNRKKYFLPMGSNGRVEVEVVKPMHNTDFCKNCTRIRVTSNGELKPCLLTNTNHINILKLIRAKKTDEVLNEAFKQAILKREPYWK